MRPGLPVCFGVVQQFDIRPDHVISGYGGTWPARRGAEVGGAKSTSRPVSEGASRLLDQGCEPVPNSWESVHRGQRPRVT